ncbi:hypothetical protein FKW77_006300 [Venturia effusa]|uniref:Calcium-dependent phosphotriesterase n=1 Tax=Venturia effusa TaxID=50376 RepID=A0A517LIY8_9PEZI|nr:hypothetical protein FKW77_006300 [Venturia effusa]
MATWTRRTIIVVFLAIAGPFLVDHLYPAYLMIRNHPAVLKNVNKFSAYKVAFEDEVRNCEDVVMDENKGVVIFSCDAGRDKWNTVMGTFIDPTETVGALWYHKYPETSWDEKPHIHQLKIDGFSDEQQKNFHPLGLGLHAETQTLYVVNHAQSGPTIEVFEVNEEATGATHRQTISHPLLHTPNSISPLSDHELLITNDHEYEVRDERLKAMLETYLSYPGGSVVYLNLKTNEAKIVASGIPFANGITMLNSTHVAVASTTTPSFSVYAINASTRDLELTLKVSVPFWIDNLKTDSAGTLLMAGHPWVPALTKVSKTNHLYDHAGKGGLAAGVKQGKKLLPLEGRPRTASWVAEWDGNAQGKIRDLFVGGLGEFGSSTSIVRDLGRGVGS